MNYFQGTIYNSGIEALPKDAKKCERCGKKSLVYDAWLERWKCLTFYCASGIIK